MELQYLAMMAQECGDNIYNLRLVLQQYIKSPPADQASQNLMMVIYKYAIAVKVMITNY